MKSALSSTSLLLFIVLSPIATARAQLDEELPPGMTSDDEEPPDYLNQEPEAPTMPARILVELGGGTSIRLIQDLDLQQEVAAPGFIDVFGAFVLPGPEGGLRHGVGINYSQNVSGDGPISDPGLDAGAQISLGPYYLAYLRFGWDAVVTGKLGVPFSLTSGTAPGLELAIAGAYYFTAGFGIYVEIGGSAWLGAASKIHPLVSGEAGVVLDYEVLP